MAWHLNSSELSFSGWVFVFILLYPGHQVPGHLNKVRPIKRVSKKVLGLSYRKLGGCKASLASMIIFLCEIIEANRDVWTVGLIIF